MLQADALGPLHSFRDSPRIPALAGAELAFTRPIARGSVGPFLTAGAPAPPPGLVGTPAANQTVTASPCGTSVFRVEGPGLLPGGQQTDQFSVIGRIAHVCGNGVLDLGEQCDDGNLVAGDCCSPTCELVPADTACDEGNVCTTNGVCDGVSAVCPVAGVAPGPCGVGNA